MSEITLEEALVVLTKERQVQLQQDADREAAKEQAEQDRVEALAQAQERAKAIIDERGVLIPKFMDALGSVEALVTQLRALHEEYSQLTHGARKLGGETGTTWPKAFGLASREEHFALTRVRTALQSIGGTV